MRQARGQLSAFVCPLGGEEHGPLIQMEGRWHCPHQSHDNPRTQCFFTDEEVIKSQEESHEH